MVAVYEAVDAGKREWQEGLRHLPGDVLEAVAEARAKVRDHDAALEDSVATETARRRRGLETCVRSLAPTWLLAYRDTRGERDWNGRALSASVGQWDVVFAPSSRMHPLHLTLRWDAAAGTWGNPVWSAKLADLEPCRTLDHALLRCLEYEPRAF